MPELEEDSGVEYSLGAERGGNGELLAVDHEAEIDGRTVRAKFYPPTLGELKEFEDLGQDADPAELRKVVEDHLVKPEIDDPTMGELNAFVGLILDHSGADDDVAAEIDAREGASGN